LLEVMGIVDMAAVFFERLYAAVFGSGYGGL